MSKRKQITLEEARLVGQSLYLDWDQVDLEQFRRGLMGGPTKAAAAPDERAAYRGVILAGRTVLAHMEQFPDYMTRLARLRAEARVQQSGHGKGARAAI